MITSNRLAASAALLAIVGCGHLPDATVRYYLAETKVGFKVTRTVVCDGNKTPITLSVATPVLTHSADRNNPVTIDLKGMRSTFSDTDVKFEFYEDGRLKGVNAATTGQGESILKAAIAVVATVRAAQQPAADPCAFITAAAGAGKPLTLTYEGTVDINDTTAKVQPIPADATSHYYAGQLAGLIGTVCAVVGAKDIPGVPATYKEQSGDVLLKARQPGLAQITVKAGGANACDLPVWEGKVPVAQLGTIYSLPMPAPAFFGKLAFSAAFLESGALGSVQYASNAAPGQVLNVVNSALALQETTAQKAADLKAQADLIAAQQRLAQCLADPATCK